ncbi:MAG: lipase chaperone LimK [Oleispira sp.]|jgi:lipase chaperone LimK
MSISLLAKSNRVRVAILLALIATLYLVFFGADTGKDTAPLLNTKSDSDRQSPLIVDIDNPEKTIATAWQWEEPTNTPDENSSPAFSEKVVYNALQKVRLDSQGNVIIDHEALIALNATLDDSSLQLDEQALLELQIIIRQGLPGNAGDDVAKIVANYYHYLEASKEFNAIYETGSSNSPAIENTTDEHKENYRELTALRELYLGSDTSTKLFSTSDANANYMFDMLEIEQATDLSDEEKQQKRLEIVNQHAEQTIDISNWNERHNVFLAAKQNILQASISDQQKQTQLTELMHQHFSHEEIAHVRHMNIDKP